MGQVVFGVLLAHTHFVVNIAQELFKNFRAFGKC